MSGSSPDIGPLDIDPPEVDSRADGAFRAGEGRSGEGRFGSLDSAQLIREHQAGVWRYLRALGAEPPLAEDLTQDTFLAVLRKPFQHYHSAATASYLRKVAHNLFVTHCRRNHQALSLAELDRIEIDWSRWTKEDNGEDLILALRDCLQTVSPRAQKALQMRFHDRASRNEIADALQLSPDGAKNLMQRAKKALRDCIEHKLQ